MNRGFLIRDLLVERRERVGGRRERAPALRDSGRGCGRALERAHGREVLVSQRPHPFRVLVEARGQLVQHPIVLPQRLEVVDARNPAVEHPRKRARAVARRPVAARPEVREQRIGLVRLALIGPIRVRGPRFLLGGARDAVRRRAPSRAARRKPHPPRGSSAQQPRPRRRLSPPCRRPRAAPRAPARASRARPAPAPSSTPTAACASPRFARSSFTRVPVSSSESATPLSISRSRIRASTLNTPSSAWRCFSSSVVERSRRVATASSSRRVPSSIRSIMPSTSPPVTVFSTMFRYQLVIAAPVVATEYSGSSSPRRFAPTTSCSMMPSSRLSAATRS